MDISNVSPAPTADQMLVVLDGRTPASASVVGGKAANLNELCGVDGASVPPACAVTLGTGRAVFSDDTSVAAALDRLAAIPPSDERFKAACADVRGAVQAVQVPEALATQLSDALELAGVVGPVAVRSSAAHEDGAAASFAGQYESYLNVVGLDEILSRVKDCWASAFADRAVAYRLEHDRSATDGAVAVIVQQLVSADASGVLFTADPVSGNRRVAAIEAVFGLGDQLVSGQVPSDSYKVREDAVIERILADQPTRSVPADRGGVVQQPTEEAAPGGVLTDAQLIRLADLGRRIEAHFGSPQDIEWCRTGDSFWVVQARPITTLFPIPDAPDDSNRIYLSVGHQQMMTDPIKPLGISIWQMTSPAPVRHAGGRMFVDSTMTLSSPARPMIVEMFRSSDPLFGDAVETVLARPGFIPEPPAATGAPPGGPLAAAAGRPPLPADRDVVAQLVAENERAVSQLEAEISGRSGPELFEFLAGDLERLKTSLFSPQSAQAIAASHDATSWLNEHLLQWLGQPGLADPLAQAAPDNIVAQMGLDLLDLADLVRPRDEIVAFLRDLAGDPADGSGVVRNPAALLSAISEMSGGADVAAAVERYLDRYGMRCPGEIDITRLRWAEAPETLVPLILSNVDNFSAGEAERRVTAGLQAAADAERAILDQLSELPDGAIKVAETKAQIDLLRTFIGYREYPKYGIIRCYWAYKKALLAEAARWVAAGRLSEVDDMFFLTFDELAHASQGGPIDHDLIAKRRAEFATFASLRPPRVLTSEGEAVIGSYGQREATEGCLIGLGVSAGVVEGIARVATDPASANLHPGDILVTAHTDPSWSALFVTAAGLITEVGGLMTHGAVVAREYGLPAVVGVLDATTTIPDGQRIRLDGTTGTVELL